MFHQEPNHASELTFNLNILNTSRYVIYIPELSDDGVLYTPMETVSISDETIFICK